ncbi:MAG: hypothetical protein IJX58_03140 [Clostridia bacterium]|nr:hypothetical protein [Clostridia bacterium]
MDINAMNLFLSEGNIKRHLEHLREARLRYSILEKSIPEIKGRAPTELVRLNINRDVKDEAISQLWYIKAHECFFSSFTEQQTDNVNVLKHYSSKEKLLYDLYTEALERDHCFLFIYTDRNGTPRWIFSDKSDGSFIRYEPILAIDLYEHVYFLDYGFDKKHFLRNALSHLKLSSLDKEKK